MTEPGEHAPEQGLDRKTRAARIMAILDELFPAPSAPLAHGDPYQLLIAVLLSAQCTDERVNRVTPALFARAPDAAAMAQLRVPEIRSYIRSLGLAGNKARAIKKLSLQLLKKYGGQVPRSIALMEELPGVGHKTASVVLAQAWGDAAFPVDTHIHRLAGRWQLSRAKDVLQVEKDLKAVFPEERWGAIHLQIIFFGRKFCPAVGHDPAACPICSWAMSKARVEAEAKRGSKLDRKPKRKTKPAPGAAAAAGKVRTRRT